MGYSYNVYLPGLDESVAVGEINTATYRNLIKSLYNKEGDLFLEQLNNIIEIVAPGILQEQITVIDYFILLLSTRMICVSPDLKLTSECPETKRKIETNIRIEDLIEKLGKIHCNGKFKKDGINIEFSLIKARDIPTIYKLDREQEPWYFAVSSLNCIRTKTNIMRLNKLSFEDRKTIVDSLPVAVSSAMYRSLREFYINLSKQKLIEIISPFKDGLLASELPVNISIESILAFMKLVFNDDLVNIYKLTYNLVSMAGFDPHFLETVTPAEQSLFWTLHLQRMHKENEDYNAKENESGTSFDGKNVSIGKTSPSEFTS